LGWFRFGSGIFVLDQQAATHIFLADRLEEDFPRPRAQHVTQSKKQLFPFITRQWATKCAELDALEPIVFADIGNLRPNAVVWNVVQDIGGDFLHARYPRPAIRFPLGADLGSDSSRLMNRKISAAS
jgi:hypothetical protein